MITRPGMQNAPWHEVEFEGHRPITVTMNLETGEVVVANLARKSLRQVAGAPMEEALQTWCAETMDALVENAVEEQCGAMGIPDATIRELMPPPLAKQGQWR